MLKNYFLFILSFSFICLNELFAQSIKHSEYYLTDKKGNKISQVFSSLGDFNDIGNAIFSIDGVKKSTSKIDGAKYGVINNEGKIIIPAKYDYLEKFSYSNDTLYVFLLHNKMGLMTANGQELIPAKYINILETEDETVVLAETEQNYYRMIRLNGEILSPLYQELQNEENGIIFKIGGYYGFMSKKYKSILPAEYTDIKVLPNKTFLVTDKKMNTFLLNNKFEKISNIKYDNIEVVTSSIDYNIIAGYIVTQRGKVGFLNDTYKMILPIEFLSVEIIETTCESYIFICTKKENEVCLYDQNGKQSSNRTFQKISNSLIYSTYLIAEVAEKQKKSNNKKDEEYDWFSSDQASHYELIDLKGNRVIKDKIEDFSEPNSYSSQNLLILKINTDYIAYDKNLVPILKNPQGSTEKYTYISFLGNSLYLVQIGGKDAGYGEPEGGIFGVYSEDGTPVLPLLYEDIKSIDYGDDLQLLVKKNAKIGLYKSDGTKVIDNLYTNIACYDGFCIVETYDERSSKRKIGLVEMKTGEIKIPVKYDFLESVNRYGKNESYIASINNKFGVINSDGKVEIPLKYNYVTSAETNDKALFLVNKYGVINDSYGIEVDGGMWGVISKNQDTLVDIKYSYLNFINDTMLLATDQDKKSYLMKFPGLEIITNKDADYIDQIGGYSDNPKYLIAKDVQFSEYGDPVGGIYGVTDIHGKMIIDFKYAEINERNDFYICTYIDFDGMDLIDLEGTIIQEKANYIMAISDTLFLVEKDNQFSFFNVQSKTSISLNGSNQVSEPNYFYDQVYLGVKSKNEKWGFVNINGDWVIEPTYCDAIGTAGKYLIVGKCDGIAYKYGVIDLENNVVIPFEYDAIEEDQDQQYKCIKGNLLYHKNLSNETLEVENATDENIRR